MSIVKYKKTEKVYAMKSMFKKKMVAKTQLRNFAERDIMAEAQHPLLVYLFCAFQVCLFFFFFTHIFFLCWFFWLYTQTQTQIPKKKKIVFTFVFFKTKKKHWNVIIIIGLTNEKKNHKFHQKKTTNNKNWLGCLFWHTLMYACIQHTK